MSDERKVDELSERLNTLAIWQEPMYEIFTIPSRNFPAVQKRLSRITEKADDLLEEIGNLDKQTKDSLTRAFRRLRRPSDRRVRHVDPSYVISAGRMVDVVRDLVDLVKDMAQNAIENTPTGAGRPSQKDLNQTVLDLAIMYEDFTSKKFRREKEKKSWTDGAEWVADVTRLLTSKRTPAPSRSELNTAMRYAVRRLAAGARVSVPWLDEDHSDPSDLQEPRG